MFERPDFVEIKMDAEIGSYQEDTGPRDEPPIAERDEREESAAPAR